MSKETKTPKESTTPATKNSLEEIDMKILVPGSVCLILLVAAGALFPSQFQATLDSSLTWIMDNFKWAYIFCTLIIVVVSFFLLFSKVGNIRFGGKDAKPSISTTTWCTLSLTGTIAVGICFYGVSGPMNLFMNPPPFLGVEGGTAEAIVPTLTYCYLHYGLPPYFIIVAFAMIISLVHYNGNQVLKGSSTLYPLLGDKAHGTIGLLVNILMTVCLTVCGTNMGLAVIQLNSGIGAVAGMSEVPSFEVAIVIFYTIATVVFAVSGVHKMMGLLSNFNAMCYVVILIFVLGCGPTNQLFGLLFTSVGEFLANFVPMVTFADPIMQTGGQSNQTMYYYSWNYVPGLLQALFYVSIAYGRTLRQFLLVNCILPCSMLFTWYVGFGGQAMLGEVNGSGLYAKMQEFGDGIATFAFLDTLPMGGLTKWIFIVVAMMTFITFSDSIAFSFPLLLLKKTETDPAMTNTPKWLNASVAVFMGALTLVLLFVGGYDAMNSMMVVMGFPAIILMIFVMISGIKMLANREKYDKYYKDEL